MKNLSIYLSIYRERLKSNVIQREVNVKESQRYNVSVLMYYHQDLDWWYQMT